MTRDQISDGLMVLVLQLGNDASYPAGWEPHEWAYVKGIGSAAILQLRDRLVERGTSPTSQTSGMSQTS